MKWRSLLQVLLWAVLQWATLISCTSVQNKAIPLASFTENYVDVTISLEYGPDNNNFLSATFTPPAGYHMYSKDIPITGVHGLGRPTLLELSPHSSLKTAGILSANVNPQFPEFEPKELMVYPAGAARLRLPVELPAGVDWTEDELIVTYMACNASQCKPPVEGKTVPVRIPVKDILDSKEREIP